MSKIKELLRQKDNVLIFDIDGVLAVQEWGEYNHYDLTDDEWVAMTLKNKHFYTEDHVIKKMQDYLKDKNMANVYVVSKSYTTSEDEAKYYFVEQHYGIHRENVYLVRDNSQKVDRVSKIMKMYPALPKHKIIMIEDTDRILDAVKEETGCATVHISSFLDL